VSFLATPEGVIFLVLASAILHAGWNTLVKSGGGDRLTFMIVFAGIQSVVTFPLLFVVDYPGHEAMIYAGASSVIHCAYFALVYLAYKMADMSQVYPISRGLAPALVALLAWVWLGDELLAMQWLGLGLVSLSILSLAAPALANFRQSSETARGVGFALLNGLVITAYLLVDGQGVRVATTPISYIVWVFFLMPMVFLLLCVKWQKSWAWETFRPQLVLGSLGGLVSIGSYALALFAMSLQPLGPIVALRETSVIFGAIFATLFLKEAFGLRRVIAAVGVFLGLYFLKIF
jgi:drug/metabolite transporter (DMT)-like permease